MANFGAFQGIIDLILSPIGIICIIAGISIYVLYWYFKRKPKEDTFEIETFEDTLLKDVDEKFKLKGIKTKASLTQGFDYLGDIDMWLRERGVHNPLVFDDQNKVFVQDPERKPKKYDIYIFRIWKTNKLFKMLGFGKKKYVIADYDHLANIDSTRGFKRWNLKPSIQLVLWGNIFVSSEAGEEYLTDIGIKRSHENTLTFLINYSRKIIYLEMKHSKAMDKYAKYKEIDRATWDRYKKAEGVEEDAEESDS